MILITPKLTKVTTTPAISIPKKIKGKAFLNGIPKTKAATEPVQPPVIGKGMATKRIRAIGPHFWTAFLCLLLVLSKSQVKNLLEAL